MDKQQWDHWLRDNNVLKNDNKGRFSLAGALKHQVDKVVKAELNAVETKSKQEREQSSLQKWIDNPMSEEETRIYLKASLDKAVHEGADIKELEILLNKLGFGVEEKTQIQVVDFADALSTWEGLR